MRSEARIAGADVTIRHDMRVTTADVMSYSARWGRLPLIVLLVERDTQT